MPELAEVSSLEWDQTLYPRKAVNDVHVAELMRVMEGGHELPPIICDRATRRIADGLHRWHAAIRKSMDEIAVEWRDYANDKEFFRDAVLLNTAHGLNLTAYDRLKVIEIGERFGLKELDLAGMLRTSPSYIKALMPRYANVAAARSNGEDTTERMRKVPLKASTRHFSGRTITPEQADAIRGNAPGTSYLLVTRQLISAIEHGLLPPEDVHPVLWQEIRKLRDLLARLTVS